MSSYADWLAAMPVEDVRRRIGELEDELTVLRVLEAQHRKVPSSDRPSPPEQEASRPAAKSRATAGRTRRSSPEREAIINALRSRPEGTSPAEIARMLGKEQNPIQTNMSRMVKAGLLVRTGQAHYRLPPEDPVEGHRMNLDRLPAFAGHTEGGSS